MTDSSQDIDIEEELEREREETPISEVEQEDQRPDLKYGAEEEDTEEPEELDKNDAFLKLKSYQRSAKVLSAAEQTLQSQILLLCSAVGGVDATSGPKKTYILGVDCLACLKDIKRWIQAVDDATNTWHVAAACHENSLVENDLIPILIQVPHRINATNKTYLQNVVLTALELMVSLTKPLVLDVEAASPSMINLYIQLKKEHVKCKEKILNFTDGRCLRAVVRIALPILKLPKDQRTNRDTIILNLCLHFIRNIIRIAPANFTISKNKSSSKTQQVVDNMPPGISKEDISYDNLIRKFSNNKVLMFIQTITAGLGTEFDTEVLSDVCLDIYFYLVYRIDVDRIFNMEKVLPSKVEKTTHNKGRKTQTGDELALLIGKEKEIKQNFFGNNMTRHANFGTLLSIKDGNGDDSMTVGTQSGFLYTDPIEELDARASKKLAATRFTNRNKESTKSDFDTSLDGVNQSITTPQAAEILKQFCSDFTEAGFTVLITQIRRIATSTSTRLGVFTEFHFLYLISWILKFESVLRASMSKDNTIFKRYGFIMVCFEEQMIRLLLVGSLPRYLQSREYNLLNAGTDCFKQILMTVIEIHMLENKDTAVLEAQDKEELGEYISLSETVLRNIFANEDIIDVLFRLPQDSQKVSLRYAVDMTDFTHVLLKALHYLSHLKVPIVLAKKIRQSRKRFYGGEHDPTVSDSDEEDEFDISSPAKLKRFQVLDKDRYNAFEQRLFHESVVNTFVWVFSRFEELNEEQVKCCISFFSRLLLRWNEHFLKLVRLDFMLTLHDIKRKHYSHKTTKALSKLLSYFMRILQKLHHHSSSILLEAMTFHQEHDPDVQMYLLGGDLMSVREKQLQTRAPDLIFAYPEMSYSYKISILVSQLCYMDKTSLCEELVKIMTEYLKKKQKLEDDISPDGEASSAIPSSPVKQPARLEIPESYIREQKKDATLRLLLESIGFVGRYLSARTADSKIQETVDFIDVTMQNPMESFEIEGKIVPKDPKFANQTSKAIIQTTGVSEKEADALEKEGEMEKPAEQSDSNISEEDVENSADFDDLGSDSQFAPDNLDMLEARLEANEKRIKGHAVKKRKGKKRRRDFEDDDPIRFEKRSKTDERHKKHKHKHKNSSKGRRNKENKKDDPKKHLSSKYVDSDDDDLDEEKEQQFYDKEKRLLELVHQNSDKPLTPEQYMKVYHPGAGLPNTKDKSEIRKEDTGSSDSSESDLEEMNNVEALAVRKEETADRTFLSKEGANGDERGEEKDKDQDEHQDQDIEEDKNEDNANNSDIDNEEASDESFKSKIDNLNSTYKNYSYDETEQNLNSENHKRKRAVIMDSEDED